VHAGTDHMDKMTDRQPYGVDGVGTVWPGTASARRVNRLRAG
jgi:hypothetical protein